MALTEYVNGSDLLLSIGGKCVGHCTSHTATFSSETKDRAVKPAASAAVSTSLWKSKGVTGLTISISGEGLHYAAEEEGGFAHLLALWKEGKTVTVKCFERENDASPYLEGPFVITQMERQAPAQDDTSYSIQLENAGAPTTLDETKIS